MKRTFRKGGIHPPEHKELTEWKAIEVLPPPPLLYIPLSQHTGAPASLKVSPGDSVAMGALIGEASGYVSANVHASVSGKVKEIVKRQNHLGAFTDYVVIENDGRDLWAEGRNSSRAYEHLTPDEIRNIIFEAGIVGMGGAAFPTHVKLNPPKEKKIDALIINGSECEPYLTCDHRLMIEKASNVATGILLLKKALGVDKVIIGIEENKFDAYSKMRAIFLSDPSVSVVLLKVKYPEGAEKQLISALLNREVPSGGLPMDVGVVVQNVGTAYATYEAVVMGRPLVERVVTVSGDGVKKKGNYLIRIGTPIQYILEACGVEDGIKKIIMGGPMMGVAISDKMLPVVKGTSGILVMKGAASYEERECVRCGRCIDACPMGLEPTAIARAVKNCEREAYIDLHPMDCMECGSCAYVCPARIELVQYIKQAKLEVIKARQKN